MATATELRSLIVRLSDSATADLSLLWAQFSSVADVRDGLMDVVPNLVDDYGDAAATVSAEWYDEYRDDLNIDGSYRADLTETNLGAEALAGWGASLITPDTVNWDAALAQITGGLVKRIATSGRDTISNNVFRDPQGVGWQRKARAEACGFCSMLAGRGTVYRSRSTADFGAHDSCQCLALPAFGNRPVPVKAYTPSERVASDADRARARSWIAANL